MQMGVVQGSGGKSGLPRCVTVRLRVGVVGGGLINEWMAAVGCRGGLVLGLPRESGMGR